MKPCPGCHGEGVHDFREEEADTRRTAPPWLLERLEMLGYFKGVVRCDSCGGTGEVTDEEHDQAMTEARVFVAEIIRRFDAMHNDSDRRRYL